MTLPQQPRGSWTAFRIGRYAMIQSFNVNTNSQLCNDCAMTHLGRLATLGAQCSVQDFAAIEF